jgi:hypothetical protein
MLVLSAAAVTDGRMLETVAIRGYRSLREVTLPLGRLSIVTGENGALKSSRYRALRLLADCGRITGQSLLITPRWEWGKRQRAFVPDPGCPPQRGSQISSLG